MSVRVTYVSLDVESWVTNVPIQRTTIIILDWIYSDQLISTNFNILNFFKFSYGPNLLRNLLFFINNKLIKQISGCPMGGPISAVLSDIYGCKMEQGVKPARPWFCKCYVADTMKHVHFLIGPYGGS